MDSVVLPPSEPRPWYTRRLWKGVGVLLAVDVVAAVVMGAMLGATWWGLGSGAVCPP